MASFDRKWLHAQLNLAFRLVVHYLRFLSPFRARYGLPRFVSNYVVEGLPWATLEGRALAAEPGRCTACGQCDEVCPLVLAPQKPPFQGPQAMISCAARAAPHFEDAAEMFKTMTQASCLGCRACERACPERIPLLEVASSCLAQLETVHRVQAAVQTDSAAMPLPTAERKS
ncbi:MAG: 4Fe-4S dicluster domain-containing protein [Myxococcota bacterium]